MAWVIGIGIGLFLLFAFPKQVGVLILGLIILAGGAYAYFWAEGEIRKAEIAKIRASARHDKSFCKSESHPIFVSFINDSKKSVERISFSLRSNRPGYSNYVTSDYLTSHRIIPSGEGYGSCWSFYKPYGQTVLPELLSWKVDISSVGFVR